jgi:hypothetical protein
MWSDAGKPTYEVRAWRERGWWLARVVGASEGADAAPINAVGHARTLTTVKQAARDVVATILDVGDDAFDVELEYVLPPVIETVVCEAIGARTWLDAARDLWREHSTVAIRALTAQGLSMPEIATLLGLPEQWADSHLEAT